MSVAAVLGVADGTVFLRDADGVEMFLRRDDAGAGNFILATSPGPGGSRGFSVAWRVELLVLRCSLSAEDVWDEVGDGKGGGEESGEEDGERC